MNSSAHSSALRNRLVSRLRLRHLHALVRLAEMGHVGRAAQSLNLTQPAVTLLLADLERLLEAPLFQRHARGVTPNALALDLLPLARQMLARLDDGAAVVAAHRHQDTLPIRAAATVAAANGLLADTLPAFCRQHPQIAVTVIDADRAELAQTIAREAIDVVFCRRPALLPAGWQFQPCREDRFAIVCGASHPLRGSGKLTPAQLAAATWLPNTPGSAAQEQLTLLSAEQQWIPKERALTTRLTELTWTMLDDGDLLALVPLSVVRPWLQRGLLHELPLPGAQPMEPLGMLLPEAGAKSAVALLAAHVAACDRIRDGAERGSSEGDGVKS